MQPKLALRIVVASPGDVEPEVSSLQDVIDEVNRYLRWAGRDVFVEFVRWKTDVYPGFHPEGPQALIDEILKIEQADLLLAVFWKRLGAAGPDGTSGAEHEIRVAQSSFAVNGKPQIMVFFCQDPYTLQAPDETEQWGKVLKLKAELSGKGVYTEFVRSQFKDVMRDRLFSYCCMNYPGATIPEISAVSIPAPMRVSSITDTVGDVFLAFKGYQAGTYNIRLIVNTEIANRITSKNMTDAALDEGRGSAPIYGEWIAIGGLLFRRVTIDSGYQNMRISGVRGNAARFVPDAVIFGALSIQPSDERVEPKSIGPYLTLGLVRRDFMFRVWAKDDRRLPLNLSRAVGVNTSLLTRVNAIDAEMTAYLQFYELLPGAFKTAAEEGRAADCGTRFRVEFEDVPPGVHIFVTTRDLPPSPVNAPKAVLVSSNLGRLGQATTNAETPETRVDGIPIVEVTFKGGTGTAVWEWIGKDSASSATLNELWFGIAVSARAGEALLGLASIGGSLAPTTLPSIYGTSADAPIPRFAYAYHTIDAFDFIP